MISKNSTRVEVARGFLRWLATPLKPELPRFNNANLGASDVESIEASAQSAVRALQSQDRPGLEALLDPGAARALDDVTYAGIKIASVTPVQIFGNSNIAFAIVDVVGSSDKVYGLRHMSFVFRNSPQGWRILQLNRNTTTDAATALFRNFDERITTYSSIATLGRPVLTEPVDNAQLPLPVSRHPMLSWTMDGGTTASFVIEMQMNVMHTDTPPPIDARDLTDSYLQFAPVPVGRTSYRISAPFAVNSQPYRVRVWALDAVGRITLSDWHAMYFAYTQPAGAGMRAVDRNTDRFGGDYLDFALQSAEACSRACAGDARCRAFSFAEDIKHCWLKDKVNPPSASTTLDSGLKIIR